MLPGSAEFQAVLNQRGHNIVKPDVLTLTGLPTREDGAAAGNDGGAGVRHGAAGLAPIGLIGGASGTA